MDANVVMALANGCKMTRQVRYVNPIFNLILLGIWVVNIIWAVIIDVKLNYIFQLCLLLTVLTINLRWTE